jgi:hypothetical protein
MALRLSSGLHHISEESNNYIFVADGLRTTVFYEIERALTADVKYDSIPVQTYLLVPLILLVFNNEGEP